MLTLAFGVLLLIALAANWVSYGLGKETGFALGMAKATDILKEAGKFEDET